VHLALTPIDANSLPAVEKHKIEMLIKHVAETKDAKFVRNGRAYDSATAAMFLRRKWRANESEVGSARAFVDKIASVSSTSGRPYLIRFPDGREIKSSDFLFAELRNLEN
jgi:hypothetical protein